MTREDIFFLLKSLIAIAILASIFVGVGDIAYHAVNDVPDASVTADVGSGPSLDGGHSVDCVSDVLMYMGAIYFFTR